MSFEFTIVPAITNLANIQILLATVIFTLTALLVFIGVQVIFILREVHRATKKLNANASAPSHTPMGVLKQALYNSTHLRLKAETNLASLPTINEDGELNSNTDSRIPASPYFAALMQESQETESSQPFAHITALQERGRQTGGRVFHRAGKPLA